VPGHITRHFMPTSRGVHPPCVAKARKSVRTEAGCRPRGRWQPVTKGLGCALCVALSEPFGFAAAHLLINAFTNFALPERPREEGVNLRVGERQILKML
jgi:hypothetical protein